MKFSIQTYISYTESVFLDSNAKIKLYGATAILLTPWLLAMF